MQNHVRITLMIFLDLPGELSDFRVAWASSSDLFSSSYEIFFAKESRERKNFGVRSR
jgi:hypothetical protein